MSTTTELPGASDFYALESVLSDDDDRALLAGVRAFMREEVAPVINDYWSRQGTREINSLIVGLSITGESAFVGK